MFSSLANSKDDDLFVPSKNKGQSKASFNATNFPCDCLGVIVQFTTSHLIINNLLLSCKAFNHYIESDNPNCCRDIVFVKSGKNPLAPGRNLMFVWKMHLDKVEVRDLDEKFFSYFPNLRYLHVDGCKIREFKAFSCLKDSLRELLYYNSQGLMNRGVVGFSKLEKLTIDNSHTYSNGRKKIDGHSFQQFPNLVKLNLCFVNATEEEFKKLKKLRKIILHKCDGFTGECFKIMTDMEEVDIRSCNKFKVTSFKHLKKVKKISVRECNSIWAEKTVKENLSNNGKGVEIHFTPMQLLLGRVRSRF